MFGNNGGELDRNNLPIKEKKSVAETFGVSDVIVPSPIPHDFIDTQYIDSDKDVSQERFQFGIGQNQEAIRAGYQNNWSKFGNAVVQSVGEATLGTLEGVGYLADWQQLGNIAQGTEDEFGNWFSDIMKAGKEYINEEVAPIYQTESAQQGFAPGDASWWANNFKSIASTASLLIPAMGVTKVAGMLGKSLRGTQTLSNINKASKLDDATDAIKALNNVVYGNKAAQTMEGVTGAVFSRYMENTMEASGTYDEEYQKLISQGIDPKEAATKAGEAASTAWNNNWGNLVFDIAQYMTLTKGINSANYASKEFRKSLLQKTLGTTGNIVGEGIEEGAQFVISKEAQRKAEMDEDYEGFKDITTRIADYSKDPEFKASVLLGAVGGGIFTGLGKGIDKAYEIAKIGVNKQRALDKGDLAEAYKEDAEGTILTAYRYAEEGKLNDLKGLYKKMGEASDEELMQKFNKTKEEVEDFRKRNKEMQEDLDFIEKSYVRLENDSIKKPELRRDELDTLVKKRFMVKARKEITENVQKAKQDAIDANNTLEVVRKKELITELLTLTILKGKYEKELEKLSYGKDVIKQFDKDIKKLTEELETLKDINVKEFSSAADAELNKEVANKKAAEMQEAIIDAKLNKAQTAKGQEELLEDYKNLIKTTKLNQISEDMKLEEINSLINDKDVAKEAKAKVNALANKAVKESPIPSDNTFESDVAKRYSSMPLLHKELAEIKEANPNVSITDITDAKSFINKHKSDRQFREVVDAYYEKKTEAVTKEQTKDVKIPAEDEMSNSAKREHADGLAPETDESTGDKAHLSNHEFMMYVRKGDTIQFFGTNDPKLRKGIPLSIANTMGFKGFRENGIFILYSEDGSPVPAESNTLTDKNKRNTTFLSERDFEVINDPNINIYGKEITFEIPMDNSYSPDIKGPDDFLVIPTIEVNGEKIKLGMLKAIYDSSTGNNKDTIRELRQQLFTEWKQSGQITGTFISSRKDIKVDGRTPGHFNISGNDRINPTQVVDDVFLATVHEDESGRNYLEFNNGEIDRGLERSTDIAYKPNSGLPKGSVVMMIKRNDGKYSPIKVYTSFLKEHPKETEIVNSIIDEIFADTAFLESPVGSDMSNEKIAEYNSRLAEYIPIKLTYHGKGRVKSTTLGKEGDDPRNHISYRSAEEMKADMPNKVMRIDSSKINTSKAGVPYNKKIADAGWITTNITPGPRKMIGSMIKLDLRGFDKGRKVEKAEVVEPATVEEIVETSPSDQQDNVQVQGDPKESEGVKPLKRRKSRASSARSKGKDRYRVATSKNYQKWNREKGTKWLRENYPNFPLQVLDDLQIIADNGGVPLWGLFKNSSIYIATEAAVGTEYHEAFHAVFHILLNDKERGILLKEFKGKDAIDKEENMADHFMEYKLTQGGDVKGLSTAVKDFFKRLYHLIQIAAERVGLKKGATVTDYMYRVDKGLYNKFGVNKNFSKDVSRFRVDDSVLNPREEVLVIGTVNSIMVNATIEDYRKSLNLSTELSKSDVVREILKVQKEGIKDLEVLKNLYIEEYELPENAEVSLEDLKVFEKAVKPNFSIEGMYATTYEIILDEIEDNAADYSEEGLKYLEKIAESFATEAKNGGYIFSTLMARAAQDLSVRFGIGISVNRIMSDEILEADELAAEGAIEGWQIEAFRDQYGKFSERAKMMFAMVELGVDPADFKVYENPIKVYAKLGRVLSSSYNEDNMMSKLEDLIEIYPQYEEVKNVINANGDLRGEMWKNIGQKHAVAFIGQATDKIFYKDGTQGKVNKVFVSNRRSASQDIIDEWQANFYASKLYNRASGTTSLDKAYLDKVDVLIKAVDSLNSPETPQEHIDTLFELLKEIHIPVFKSALNRVFGVEGGTAKFKTFLGKLDDGLRSLVYNITEGKDPFFGGVSSEKSLEKMAGIIVEGTDDTFKMSFMSMAGKLNYTLVDNRQSLDLLNKLKSTELSKSLLASYRKDPFFKNSPILDTFDSVSARKEIHIGYFDAFKNEDRSKVLEYKDMTPAQLEAFQIANWFRYKYDNKPNDYAYYMLPILADSTSAALLHYKKEDEVTVRENLVRTAQQERDRIEWLKERIAPVQEEYDKWISGKGSLPSELSDIPYNVLKNGIKYQIFTGLNGDSITDKNFATKVNEMINKNLKTERQALYDIGVLEMKNGRSVDLTDMLDNRIINNFDKNADLYLLNRMYMNLQTLFLFGGDIASYKSKKGDVDFTDVYKRIKQIHSPQNKLSIDPTRTFKLKDGSEVKVREFYNNTYLQDPTEVEKIRTIHKDLIEELFPGEECKWIRIMYGTEDDPDDPTKGGLNNTDAATYIDIFRAREIYLGTAEWNDSLQEQYDNIIAGRPIKFDKGNQVNVKKPFHYSHRFIEDKANPNLLHVVATQLKNSEAVLTPQMAKGNPKLEAILEKMGYEFKVDGTVTFDESKRITDAVIFTSAVKVGQLDVVKDVADISPTNVHKMKNSDYAIQQETPEHHIDSSILAGTQNRKIIVQDLMKEGIYKIGNKEMTGEKVFDTYQEAINRNILDSFEELKKLFYNEDGTPDLNSIVKVLRKEAIEKGFGEDTLSAFDWINSSKDATVLPLWHPSISYNVEAIMNSYFKNNITKQKMFGVSLYNASSYGYEENNDKGLRKPKLVIERDKDGKPYIKEVEVLMPAHSKAIYEKYTGADGYLDINAVPDDLKMGMFYRIPTEGKYSMFHIKVIGYIEGVGGQIIMPDEVTTIAGLDFDIDKLYGMMYHFTEVDGKLVKVPSGMDSKEARDNLIIDIQYGIMSHPDTIRKQLTPGNYNTLNKAKERVIELEGREKTVLNPMLPSTQREVFERNMTGAALIGIAANQNVNHSLMTEGDFYARNDISFDGKKLRSFSNNNDDNGNLISSSTAEPLASFVDNAKDPVASFLNLTTITTDLAITMIRAGHDPYSVYMFVASPAAKRFSKELSKLGTSRPDIKATLDRLMLEEKAAISNISAMDKFNDYMEISMEDRVTLSKIEDTFSKNTVAEMYTNYSIYELLKSTFEKAHDLVDTMRAMRFDAIGKAAGPRYADTIVLQRAWDKAMKIDGNHIVGFKKFIESNKVPYLKSFYEKGILMPIEEDKNIILDVTGLPYDKELFTKIVDRFGIYNAEGDLNGEEIANIYNHINTALITGYSTFKQSRIREVVESVPERVRKYKLANPEGVYSILMEQFIPKEDSVNDKRKKDKSPFPYIEFNRTGLDKVHEASIKSAWKRMLHSEIKDERDLARDIATYAFFSTGYTFNYNTFSDIVPVAFISQLHDSEEVLSYRDYLSRMHDREFSNTELEGLFEQIVRNGYRSMRMIPFIDPRSDKSISKRQVDGVMQIAVPFETVKFKGKDIITGETDKAVPYIKVPTRTKEGLTTMLYKRIETDGQNNVLYAPLSRLGVHNKFVEYDITNLQTTIGSVYPTLNVILEKEEAIVKDETITPEDRKAVLEEMVKAATMLAAPLKGEQLQRSVSSIRKAFKEHEMTMEAFEAIRKEAIESDLDISEIELNVLREMKPNEAEEIMKKCRGKK